MMNREKFLTKATALKNTTVHIPEWGDVRIRELTAKQRSEFEQMFADEKSRAKNIGNARIWWLVNTVIDDAGKLMFMNEDADRLEQLPAAPLERIVTAAVHLSGMSPAALEEMRENFTKTRRGDSASG